MRKTTNAICTGRETDSVPPIAGCEVRRSICRLSRSTSNFNCVFNSSFLHSKTIQVN